MKSFGAVMDICSGTCSEGSPLNGVMNSVDESMLHDGIKAANPDVGVSLNGKAKVILQKRILNILFGLSN